MQHFVTKILWKGKGNYQIYRDRKTLECAWVPWDLVPKQFQIDPQDVTEIRGVPKEFEQIDSITFANETVAAEGEAEMKPMEQEDVCSAFGHGWDEDDEECRMCENGFPDEYQECRTKTIESMSESEVEEKVSQGMIEMGFISVPKKERKIELDILSRDVPPIRPILPENEEEPPKLVSDFPIADGCPFKIGTKAAVLYSVISQELLTQADAIKEACRRLNSSDKAYMYFLVAKWKKEGVPKTGEFLHIIDGKCVFEEGKQE